MLQKVQFDEYSAALSLRFCFRTCLAIRATLWSHNPCNVRTKCCVAIASKNITCVKLWLHLRFSSRTGSSTSANCSATKVEAGCTCNQVSSISVTCYKKFNLMNILQNCFSNFVADLALTHATFWFHSYCNIRKKCCVASASKNVTCVKLWLHLRFSSRTGSSKSSKLFCDKS